MKHWFKRPRGIEETWIFRAIDWFLNLIAGWLPTWLELLLEITLIITAAVLGAIEWVLRLVLTPRKLWEQL